MSDEVQKRERYVKAWTETMLMMWRDRIRLLGVYDTGALLTSLHADPVRASAGFTELDLRYSFVRYGLYQDMGTGRETPVGNPGDIGRDKIREARRWFSRPYFSSVMNITEFMGESIGEEFVGAVSAALSDEGLRRNVF